MERTTPANWHHGKLTQWILPSLVFGALWCLLVAQLSQYWALDPEYSFGWFVPILCAFLFLMRWEEPASARGPEFTGGKVDFLDSRACAAANLGLLRSLTRIGD